MAYETPELSLIGAAQSLVLSVTKETLDECDDNAIQCLADNFSGASRCVYPL